MLMSLWGPYLAAPGPSIHRGAVDGTLADFGKTNLDPGPNNQMLLIQLKHYKDHYTGQILLLWSKLK